MDYVRAGVALVNPHCSGTYQARAEMKRLAIPLITAYIDPLYREVRMRIRIYSRRAQHATLSDGLRRTLRRRAALTRSLPSYHGTRPRGGADAQRGTGGALGRLAGAAPGLHQLRTSHHTAAGRQL